MAAYSHVTPPARTARAQLPPTMRRVGVRFAQGQDDIRLCIVVKRLSSRDRAVRRVCLAGSSSLYICDDGGRVKRAFPCTSVESAVASDDGCMLLLRVEDEEDLLLAECKDDRNEQCVPEQHFDDIMSVVNRVRLANGADALEVQSVGTQRDVVALSSRKSRQKPPKGERLSPRQQIQKDTVAASRLARERALEVQAVAREAREAASPGSTLGSQAVAEGPPGVEVPPGWRPAPPPGLSPRAAAAAAAASESATERSSSADGARRGRLQTLPQDALLAELSQAHDVSAHTLPQEALPQHTRPPEPRAADAEVAERLSLLEAERDLLEAHIGAKRRDVEQLSQHASMWQRHMAEQQSQMADQRRQLADFLAAAREQQEGFAEAARQLEFQASRCERIYRSQREDAWRLLVAQHAAALSAAAALTDACGGSPDAGSSSSSSSSSDEADSDQSESDRSEQPLCCIRFASAGAETFVATVSAGFWWQLQAAARAGGTAAGLVTAALCGADGAELSRVEVRPADLRRIGEAHAAAGSYCVSVQRGGRWEFSDAAAWWRRWSGDAPAAQYVRAL